MMFFERCAQARKDFNRILDAWFIDVDLLEPPQKCAVFFEMIAEFLVGGRTDATDRATRQSRFQQVRRIHRAAAGGASADNGVNFVDKQDGIGQFFQF